MTNSATNRRKKSYTIAILALMIAITVILVVTPLGSISLGIVSITIAHIPILITAILLGLKEGLVVASSFGISSLLVALLAPRGLLDPLFVNPMISILPRLMIPITTYFVFRGIRRLNNTAAVISAVVVGNLTNTFFVYFSMYLFVRERVEAIMGKNFKTVIIGLVSTSTAIKTVGVALLTVPIVLALQRFLKTTQVQ